MENTYNEFKCIGMEEPAFRAIFEKYGYTVTDLDFDMGCVGIVLDDESVEPYELLKNHFDCKITVFCADTDQEFPNAIMILLETEVI